MKTKSQKGPITLYLPNDLMKQARNLSTAVGIPLSRLAADGIVNQLERWTALRAKEGNGNAIRKA